MAGTHPVAPEIQASIRRVLGGADVTDPDWPRDAGIVGDAVDAERFPLTRRPDMDDE